MIAVGDFVTIGKESLTWEVEKIWPDHRDSFGIRGSAELRSGLSGRRRVEWLDNIHLHTKKGGTA